MTNNIFQQQNPANNSYVNNPNMMMNNPMMGMGYAQNNGLNFGNKVTPAPKQSTSTPEEMNLIKSGAADNFNMTDKELAVASWDLRDDTSLAVETIDPSTDRMRIKYTNEEFNLMNQPPEVLNELLNNVDNFVCTTKITNTSDKDEIKKELFRSWGIVKKLLPIAYANGQKNIENLYRALNNSVNAAGYQGNWGANSMYNGMIGSVPNYFIPSGGAINNYQAYGAQQQMMNGQMNNPAAMQQMIQQAVQMGAQMGAQNYQQQLMNTLNNNMGVPMPTGGTMMNNNPFVQGGQPQQQMMNNQMPQMNNNSGNIPIMGGNTQSQQTIPNLNNIPTPGTPVTPSGTQNPSMGTGTNNTTTATADL